MIGLRTFFILEEKKMKHLKKVMAVLLVALFCTGCLIMASAETIIVYNGSYSFVNGTLTFSKNKGNNALQWEGNLFPDYLNLSYTSVKTVVMDDSLDSVQGVKTNGNGTYLGEETVGNGDLWIFALEPVGGLKQGRISHYIENFAYPQTIENRSMKAVANTATSYWLAPNGRKIVGIEEEASQIIDAIMEEVNEVDEAIERQNVSDFNADFGTNFSTWEECNSFLSSNLKAFYAPTLIRCKKGSQQQMFCRNNGINYTLLDDSTSKSDNKTGVKATYNNYAFNTPVSLSINKVNSGKDSVVSYNITPTDENGNKVQPNEAMEISLPIPNGWNENDIQVRHEKDDGTTENLEFVVDENNAVFYTSSCSVFSLVNTAGISAGEQTDEPTTEEPTTDSSTQPQKDQASPNLNFFQLIIRWFKHLFAKIFKR